MTRRHLVSKKDLRSIMGAIEKLSTELESGLVTKGPKLTKNVKMS